MKPIYATVNTTATRAAFDDVAESYVALGYDIRCRKGRCALSDAEIFAVIVSTVSVSVAVSSFVLALKVYRRGAPRVTVKYEGSAWTEFRADGWPETLELDLRIVNDAAAQAFIEEVGVHWSTRAPRRTLRSRGCAVGWRAGDKPLTVGSFDSERAKVSVPVCPTTNMTMHVEARGYVRLKTGGRRFASALSAASRSRY